MDLVLQLSTQSHCQRIVNYFHQREELHVFPPGPFADSAEELGSPRSHTKGPCLVLLRNMQLSPEAFNAWFVGSIVERPCTRLYWLQQSVPPAESRQALLQAILAADLPADVSAVRLDAYPKAVQAEMGDELEAAGYSVPLQPADYSHVLYVVQMPGSNLFHWSYMDRRLSWKQSHEKPARFNKSVATAINKVAESMQVLGLGPTQQSCLAEPQKCEPQQHSQSVQQQEQQQCPTGGQPTRDSERRLGRSQQQTGQQQRQQQGQQGQQGQHSWAIDVGACPGGWSSYLADSCGYSVIAIDPADMHPDVTSRPGVHHLKLKSSDAGEEIDKLLQGGQADLLVCDANDHVTRLPHFLGPVLPKLKSGGWLVVTLKFYGRGNKSCLDDVAASMAKLLPGLEPGRCVWLLANTLCERTYMARKG